MRFEEAYGGWMESRLTQEEAALLLGVCARTFRRYIDRYHEEGLDGLIDKRVWRQLPTPILIVAEHYNDLLDFFLPNKVYFDEKTTTEIQDILDLVRDVFLDITCYPVDTAELHGDRESLKERREFWGKAREKYEGQFGALSSRLENTFRGFLGVGIDEAD